MERETRDKEMVEVIEDERERGREMEEGRERERGREGEMEMEI